MSDLMILHHYENSPYAEKIRLMFGMTGSSWCSLLSPAWPPRPNVDPLSGGYRRIPIAQRGADIFCDTALIAREVAHMSDEPELDPANCSGEALELMRLAEGQGFFAAITSLPPYKLLGTMLLGFGPVGAYRFIKDRSGLLKGGSSRPPQAGNARAVMEELFDRLESRLSTVPWIGGEAPTIADFAVYHPIWLHLNCMGRLPKQKEQLHRWYGEVGGFGHGERREITRDDAFDIARNAQPRSLPASIEDESHTLGQPYSIAPEDYGVTPVNGILVALTDERVVIARETDEFGMLHVHFPRSGYALTPFAGD